MESAAWAAVYYWMDGGETGILLCRFYKVFRSSKIARISNPGVGFVALCTYKIIPLHVALCRSKTEKSVTEVSHDE